MLTRRIAGSFLTILFLLAALPVTATQQEEKDSHPEITWLSYHEARAVARADDKPIFLHFGVDWSQWDQAMRRETYRDREVILYLKEHFVCGMVDVENQRALAKRYGVESYPTLWFLDSEGRSLTSVGGMLTPEKLLLVLEFVQTEAFHDTTYEAWKEKRLGR